MLIDHNSIVQKTDLRQNLAQVLSRVYRGETLHISDRGSIKATLTPVITQDEKKKKFKLMMSQLNNIREQLAKTDFAKLDTTKFIRQEREKRLISF